LLGVPVIFFRNRSAAVVDVQTIMRFVLFKTKRDGAAHAPVLDKTAWNKAKAARLLGMDRVTLYRKIKRYDLAEDTPRHF